MNIRKSAAFELDLAMQAAWYAERGGVELAERFLGVVEATVGRLAQGERLGRRRFRGHPALGDTLCANVNRPFHRQLLFYHESGQELLLDRLLHGARDLPRRLVDQPGSEA